MSQKVDWAKYLENQEKLTSKVCIITVLNNKRFVEHSLKNF